MNPEQSQLQDATPLETRIGPRRSRNGCQQCRQRKRKCDEQHPRCRACSDRDLPCSWEREPRRRQVARRNQQFNKDFTLPQEMRCSVTVFAAPSTPTQERLLSYFNTHGPLWLTSSGNAAACSRVIIPVAARNPLVLNCVLALAAGDLGKYQPASTEMASLACGFYGQAIAGVNSALGNKLSTFSGPASPSSGTASSHSDGKDYHTRDPPPPPPTFPTPHDSLLFSELSADFFFVDDLLLAIVLLCVHEVGSLRASKQRGKSLELIASHLQAVNFVAISRLFPHLSAAATLCHSRRFTDKESSSELRGLLYEVLCYQFTLTAFSHGCRLPLHLAPEVFASLLSWGDDYKGVLLGRQCREVFSIILQVAMLQSGLTSPYNLCEFRASELTSLMCQLERRPVSTCRDDKTAPDDQEAVSELFRLACLIHVKKILYPRLHDSSAEIQGILGRFISTLNSLPPTSPANNILCWPLYLAGASSVVPSHRRLIIGRLRRNYGSWWRSDILSKSADLLSDKWRRDKNEDGGGPRCADYFTAQWPGVANHMADFPLVLL